MAWEGTCTTHPIRDTAVSITGEEFKLTSETGEDSYHSFEESCDLAIRRPLPDAHQVADGLEAIFTRSQDDMNGPVYRRVIIDDKP